MIPQCIGIGISYEQFWTLNPRKLQIIFSGYKEQQKHVVDQMYAMGRLFFAAESVSLANLGMAFSKHKKKPLSFDDVVKPPNYEEEKPQVVDGAELSAEDKRKYTELIFTNLKIRMANFQIAQGGKK